MGVVMAEGDAHGCCTSQAGPGLEGTDRRKTLRGSHGRTRGLQKGKYRAVMD